MEAWRRAPTSPREPVSARTATDLGEESGGAAEATGVGRRSAGRTGRRGQRQRTFVTFRSALPLAPKGVDRLKAARDDHSPGQQHTLG